MLLVNTVGWLGHVELQLSPNRGIAASPDIVVISQTRETLSRLGQDAVDEPVPRRFHSQLVRALSKAGAKVVVMDYEFGGEGDEKENQLVRRAVEDAAPTKIVLGRVQQAGQQFNGDGEPSVMFNGNFV